MKEIHFAEVLQDDENGYKTGETQTLAPEEKPLKKRKRKKRKFYYDWKGNIFRDKDGQDEGAYAYYDNTEVNVLIRKPPKYPFRPFRKRRYKDGDRVVLLIDMFGFKKGDVGTVAGRAINKKDYIVVSDYEYLSEKRKKAICDGIIQCVGLEISSKGIKPYK